MKAETGGVPQAKEQLGLEERPGTAIRGSDVGTTHF